MTDEFYTIEKGGFRISCETKDDLLATLDECDYNTEIVIIKRRPYIGGCSTMSLRHDFINPTIK